MTGTGLAGKLTIVALLVVTAAAGGTARQAHTSRAQDVGAAAPLPPGYVLYTSKVLPYSIGYPKGWTAEGSVFGGEKPPDIYFNEDEFSIKHGEGVYVQGDAMPRGSLLDSSCDQELALLNVWHYHKEAGGKYTATREGSITVDGMQAFLLNVVEQPNTPDANETTEALWIAGGREWLIGLYTLPKDHAKYLPIFRTMLRTFRLTSAHVENSRLLPGAVPSSSTRRGLFAQRDLSSPATFALPPGYTLYTSKILPYSIGYPKGWTAEGSMYGSTKLPGKTYRDTETFSKKGVGDVYVQGETLPRGSLLTSMCYVEGEFLDLVRSPYKFIVMRAGTVTIDGTGAFLLNVVFAPNTAGSWKITEAVWVAGGRGWVIGLETLPKYHASYLPVFKTMLSTFRPR